MRSGMTSPCLCECGCGGVVPARAYDPRRSGRYILGHSGGKQAWTVDRFWSTVALDDDEACWPWPFVRSDKYGSVRWRGVCVGCHVLAWTLSNGAIVNGLWVLHRCDNRPCCNPSHLFLGTVKDNAVDASVKGRLWTGGSVTGRGVTHHSARLTPDIVRALRASTASHRELARQYGISSNSVWKVLQRKSWKDVV